MLITYLPDFLLLTSSFLRVPRCTTVCTMWVCDFNWRAERSTIRQADRQKVLSGMERESTRFNGTRQRSTVTVLHFCPLPPITISLNSYYYGTLLDELHLFRIAIGSIMYVLAWIHSTVQCSTVLLQCLIRRGRRANLLSQIVVVSNNAERKVEGEVK